MAKKLQIIVIALLAGYCFPAQAQRSVEAADRQFDAFEFEAAAAMYQNALESRKGVADEIHVLSRIGDCYRLLNRPADAEPWYVEAVGKGAGASIRLHLAQTLRSNARYEEAAIQFERYAALSPNDPGIAEIINGLRHVEALSRPDPTYTVEIMPVNSDGSDFGPFVHDGRFYFTTNGKPAKTNGTSIRQDAWTGSDFLQVYQADITEPGSISDVRRMNNKTNGPFHDGPVSIDPLTGDMYITRNHYVKQDLNESGIVHLKVVRREPDGEGGWSDELLDDFPFNSNDHSVGHVAFSPDGRTIYFSSDMESGTAIGGVDLYKAERSGDRWTDLQNLGPGINTKGDEMFPFAASDGRLYFASSGREGLGGLDIYEAVDDSGEWMVFNMGAPINTNHDDFSLVLQPGSCQGYFTSNRPADKADDNIYAFCDNGIMVVGTVVDARTREPLKGAAVKASGISAHTEYITRENGQFRINVLPETGLGLTACAADYICNAETTINTAALRPGAIVRVEIPMEMEMEMTVRVVDAGTGEPIAHAGLGFDDVCDDSSIRLQARENGTGTLSTKPGCSYGISAWAPGYFKQDIAYESDAESPERELVIALEKHGVIDVADLEDGLVFHHIYFGYDQSEPVDQSVKDLDLVLDFMRENPDVQVSIEAHADSRASDRYNIALSERRARSVMDRLTAGGIDPGRLRTAAYGESSPVNACSNETACTEADHQMNRRTEFRIVQGLVETRSLERFGIEVDPCRDCPMDDELSIMP